MPKQLNVNLAFTADTKQAQQQIAQLQKSLDDLMSSSVKDSAFTGFNKDISNAQQSVLKLKTAINNSLNADTGRLDLSKFNQQLNSSGLSLGKLASDMTAMGSDGQKAFLNLANSIVTAQKPVAETNKLLDGMWTALKNTARWQLSSSILHGFMGALQGAYGYAQDLNQSLNNIRIVTGQSTDQMAAFAEQANKSAQALSTSTLAYTDAALIYYQQGLGDEEVQARTETTLKMSNVTRDSVEEVSSYMTAIWNNFAEGADNLELFADKITALGAATASSSAEIAQGLNQFAALGSSLGLNYDDAVAALATVVAQTRQSASTVGNSFRTLFQRIESLKLGETLEDGVGLTKYSLALEKVGVQVLDVNGEMRDMHDVIQDLGAVWQNLSKAQQNALAQTVGGVRNSNTLIAWMDNFEKFQENLNVSYNAEGALEEQAEIYAESWEAAKKRVQAAWQAIYQDLINDKFFISISNGIGKILESVDSLIDSIGGLPGVLSGLGILVTTIFEKQMVDGIQHAQQQLRVFTGTAQAESDAMGLWVKQNLDTVKPKGDIEGTSEALAIDNIKTKLGLTIQLKEVYDQLSESQKEFANNLLESVGNQQQLTLEAKKTEEELMKSSEISMRQLRNSIKSYGADKELTNFLGDTTEDGFDSLINKLATLDEKSNEFRNTYDQLYDTMVIFSNGSKDQINIIEKVIESKIKAAQASIQYKNAEEKTKEEVSQFNARLQDLVQGHHNGYLSTEELIAALENEKNSLDKTKMSAEEYKNKIQELEIQIQKLKQSNQGVFGPEFAQNLVNSFKGISQLTMGVNSLSSAFDALGNKDLSWMEKIQRFATGVSFGAPALLNGSKQVGKDISGAYNQIYSYFGQKAANQGIQSVINENISRMDEIKGALNNSTGSAWFSEDAIFEVANLKNELKELEQTNKTLSSGIKGGLTVWEDLGTTISNVAGNVMSFIAANAELIAGIAAVAAAIWVAKRVYDIWYENTPEGKLAAANEELDKAKEKVQETADKYKELKGVVDEYKEAVENINNIESKEERLDAILEENKKVIEFLEENDLWNKIGKIEYDENGLIVLTEEQQKILLNDSKREASLARQAEYQAKINQLSAQNAKDYKDSYDGNKIKVLRETGKQNSATLLPNGEYASTPEMKYQDVTREIAQVLNQKNLGLGALSDQAGREAIVEALRSGNFSDDEIKNTILPKLEEIVSDTTLLEDFNELQRQELENDQEEKAWRMQNAQEQIGQQALDSSPLGLVQNSLLEAFSYLKPEEQAEIYDALQESGMSLVEAWTGAADIITQSTQLVREELISKISNANNGEKNNESDVSNWVNGLSEEHLKIATELDINYEDTLEDVQHKFTEALNSTPVEFDTTGLTKKQAQEAQEEFAQLTEYIQKASTAVDENGNKINELSDHLADCKREASQIAKAIMRFDDAIQDVTDNYEDWNKALTTGSMQDAAKAATALTKTYGNLLDIDGSVLSSQFLENADNLDLMKSAIEGNEDAYEDLQAAANEDIVSHLTLVDDDFYTKAAELQTYIDSQAFDDLEVGANLDTGNFLNQLTDLVNAAHMTEEQATAYLANMGIDATVTKIPADTEEVAETETEWVPSNYTTEVLDTGGEENPGSTFTKVVSDQSGHWEPHPSSHVEQSSPSAYTLEVTSAHKSSGGNFKFQNANHGGGSGNSGKKGGSCFASGTLITTDHNYKNIEDIKIGDTVLSYNEKTKKNEYSKVLQTMIHNVYEKIYDLFVKDDKLKVTGNHRFLVVHNNEQKWIEAADLQVDDSVLFADGTLHQISKIKTQTRFITVYNFEVSNTHNYYVGKSQILAHNKGGGGKGSQRKPKEPVKYQKKEDRYHDLKEQLEDVRLEYDKVNKAKDRAFGKSKLKYLDLEIKQLEKEDKLLKDYVKEAENYYKIDRSKVENLNIGVKFDEKGALINYEEVLSRIEDDMVKATNEYNKAITAWNAGGSDEDLEKAEKAKKDAEELQKTRMDALKQLEDTYNTWQDKVWEEIQKRWEIYDAKLEKVTLNVEIELEFNEDDLKLLQFIFDRMGDSADTAVDKIANLNEQMKEYDDNIKHIRSGLQGIFANHGIKIDLNNMNPDEIAQQLVSAMDNDTFASELTDEEAKTIRDYISQLMDNTKNLEESFDKVFETVKEGYDQWNERLQDQMGEYARLNKIVSSYKDLVSLTGKDVFGLSYDELNKWNQELVHVAEDQAKSAEKIWRDNEKLYQNAVAMYNTAETEEEKKKWKEIMDQRKKTTDEAHQDYLDKVNEWQEAIQTAFEEALDYAKDKYEKSFGQFNFNFIEDEYERLADLDKLYLKPYEKYHDLQKSLKDLSKSITNTTNPTVLSKMLTLQDEINDKMASGVQMSSYETGIIERRVALLQAEADLQNAKNAKGAVRMTRDNEGNFSYTYTADQDAIDDAQENLSEKFYELLKFERDSLDEIQDRILQETRTYQEALDDLARTYGKDSEEYKRYAEIVTNDHIEKMRYLESQSDMLYREMARLRDDDWHDLERIFNYKLASTEDFLDMEEKTLLGSLFGEGGIFPTIRSSEQQYLQDIQDDVTTYGANTQAVVDNVTTNMKEDIKSIGTAADETKEKVHDLGEEMKKAMTDADTAAKGIAQTWADHMKKVRDDTTSTASNLNELLKKLNSITTVQKSIADGYKQIKDSANAAATAMQSAANTPSGGGSPGGGGNSPGGSWNPGGGGPDNPPAKTSYMYYVKTPTGSKVKLGSYTSDSEASGHFYSYMNKVGGPSGVYCLYRNDTNTGIYRRIGNVGGALGNKTNISRYASGGYTGDWGDSSGKLAILHRKEIVLNKEDTSNFLDAVGIVRSIKDFIDMGARNLSNVFNYNVMAGAGTADLQQQVHIDASFPNVQSHNEIELALNNLINSATQYVNRK